MPANKGLRRPGYSIGRGRMQETQFKKGQMAGAAQAKWRPIGTILRDSNGYLRIKIAERVGGKPPGWNPKIWPALHRHNWEQKHGPLPPGHIVVFRDGNRDNCSDDNLELITLAENMRRNTIHRRLPPDVKEAVYAKVRLKAFITRKLKKGVARNGEEHHVGPSGPPLRDARSA